MRLDLRALALPAVLLLAACGGSYSTGGSAGTGAGVNLDAQDFMYSPNTISAKSGDKVTVTVTNKGSYTHNFSIAELGVSQDIAAGSSQTVTFTASGTTNLMFFCKYHRSKGMTGTLDLGGGNTPGNGASAPSSDQKTYGSGY